MNRRQFLGLSVLSAAVLAVPPASHHSQVPYRACHSRPSEGVIGDCYVFTRGTYASTLVPNSAKPKGVFLEKS